MSSILFEQDSLVEDQGATLVVVVLYKKNFDHTPAAHIVRKWLSDSVKNRSDLYLKYCLIYDNSPTVDFRERRNDAIDFFHDASNGGTRSAYLHALKTAKEKGCSWILFLDHDTALPANFFLNAQCALDKVAQDIQVGAIVPKVYEKGTLLSPCFITPWGRTFSFTRNEERRSSRSELSAIASASLVMRKSLERILPIPKEFSLDYLDHWIFRQIQRNNEKILISSARIEHSLSVRSMKLIVVDRYDDVLAAELAFLSGNPNYSPFRYFLLLAMRAVKLLFSTGRITLVSSCYKAMLNVWKEKIKK